MIHRRMVRTSEGGGPAEVGGGGGYIGGRSGKLGGILAIPKGIQIIPNMNQKVIVKRIPTLSSEKETKKQQ